MSRLRVLVPTPLIRGVALVWKSAPGWAAAHLFVLVLQGLVPLAALYLMKLIVDAVEQAVDGTVEDAFARIGLLVLMAGLTAAAGVVLRTLGLLVSEVQSLRLGDQVHDLLHSKSVQVDIEYYESAEYHDTLHRAQQEAPYRPARIVEEVARTGQNGISLLAIAGLLFSFHWALACVLFLAAVPGVLHKVRYSQRLYDWTLRQTPAMRRSRYINSLLTGGAFAKEIRLFGLGHVLRSRFRELRAVVRDEKFRLVRRRSVLDMVAQTLAVAAVFGSLFFVARAAIQGSITIGDMVMLFGAFQRGQDFFSGALGALAGLYEDNLFLSDLDVFMNLEPRVAQPAEPKPFPRPVKRGITLEHVSFHYPGLERRVLEDIHLEVRPGEHVALVGENGSGKTTLVKLLCRLYDPTGGVIRVDGTDIREFSTDELRREIGITFQDFARYQLSVRDNIWFGNVRLDESDPRIERAAQETGADAVIRKLPGGYDTILGREYDAGAELSLGEWQKVALARAFLSDAQIIVLDEPTASLDARSEAEVFERFHELARGRTAILISHRLSTVRMADRIVVLANGRIIEAGDHDQLVASGGAYAQLFELQAKHYR